MVLVVEAEGWPLVKSPGLQVGSHGAMACLQYLFQAVCCPLPLAKDEGLRKKCPEVPLCLMMSSSWLRLEEVEEDMAREEMETLAVEGKIQLTASNCPGMGLWMTGSMWEALMEGTEVMTSMELNLCRLRRTWQSCGIWFRSEHW